jgi:hypothetical protein
MAASQLPELLGTLARLARSQQVADGGDAGPDRALAVLPKPRMSRGGTVAPSERKALMP